MSESEYQRLVECLLQSTTQPMIATDTGIEAAQKIGKLAEQEEITWRWQAGWQCTCMAVRA